MQIWNGGDYPLKQLPVRIALKSTEGDDSKVTVFNVQHSTTPKDEFGKIVAEDVDLRSKRFTYELMNQGDRDIITLLTNTPSTAEVFSKAEDMRVVRVAEDIRDWPLWLSIMELVCLSGMVGAVAAGIVSIKQLLKPTRR